MYKKNNGWCWLMALLATSWTTSVLAENQQALPAIEVRAEIHALIGVADSASDGKVTEKQLAHRPFLRPGEVLETVPGLIVTQHSGDGKANQYFLRGFNLDHGSDFATYVNGMPINMVSHAHGQGYMDLNFLIPELIGGLRYQKGPYAAEDGDFNTTGSARIQYKRSLKTPFAALTVGEYQYQRFLTAGSAEWNGRQLLGAAELVGYDGPWDQSQNLNKVNLHGSVSEGTASDGYTITAMAYKSTWVASEHVPQRAIDSGEIGRFGTLVPNDGGKTHRISLSGEWNQSDERSSRKINAWVIDYGLNLFSAPSGYINGPDGDQHEQEDHRILFGGQAEKHWLLPEGSFNTEVIAGAQLRHDRIGALGLYDTVNRVRTNTVSQNKVNQTGSALYTELKTPWLSWLRTNVGLRYDTISADVNARGGQFNLSNGGSETAHQVSPKLGLAIAPFNQLEFYANWGRGFHSNDIRGAVITNNAVDGLPAERVPLLAKSTGGEIGLRAAPFEGWQTALAVWQVKSASELVFVGDEGITEPRGSSHRYGVEWTNHLTLSDYFFLDADLALSKARFDREENGGRHVPNAIPVSASLAANYDDGSHWSGGIRVRYIGSYALEETGTQKSSSFLTANARLDYQFNPHWQLSASILNLLNRKANDIEYWGGACSRQDGAGCGGGQGIDGRLVHPLEPRTLRVGLRYNF
jgi:outer membrane receptor protein involved in Fe transport